MKVTPILSKEKFEERILPLLEEKNGCLEWSGCKYNSKGYGYISIGNVGYRVHRIAYAFANQREVVSSEFICHTCDNPKCCNPEHLWIGDNDMNSLDRDQKGRQKSNHENKTHCPNGHPYSPENTYVYPSGRHRDCKECHKLACRRYRARKKAEKQKIEVSDA